MNKKLCVAVLAVICSLSLLAGAKGFFKAEATTETKCLTSVSITLEKSITVNYFIENADNYTSAKMSFVYRNGQATKELPAEIVGGKAKVSFEGLAPQYMTDKIQATLTLYNGEEVAKTEENTFTVAGYVKDLLALDKESGVSVEEYENMRALAVSLLYYGDEAQKYVATEDNETVGTLASSVLTDDEKALKATAEPLTESEYSAPANNDGQKFRWVGYGARFDSMLGVYFEFIANTTENLVIKFNDGTETSYFEAYEKTVGENKITVYKAIKELFACDYAKTVTAEAYIGSEKVGSAITYGVKSLTADFESTTKEHALALNAAIYGEAAAKYAQKHTCEFIDGAVETAVPKGITNVNQYTDVATGLNVTGQKLAKICKFCGKVSDEGATATEIYDIDENVLSGATVQKASGTNVPFATARAMDGDFASGFTSKSGAKLTFGLYSDEEKTATVVLKASSGYIVTDGGKWGGGEKEKRAHYTAKTENMQFNKVFSTALNGKAIAVGNDVMLYGDIATGGDNYKILGSFTYVPFVLELKAGYNELTFTADVENTYRDNGGSVSSPRVDSLASYDGVKIVKSTCVNNGETHVYESLTGGENVLEAHSFADVIADSNIKEAANCQHGTIYFRSCEKCGAKSEETFDDGKKTAHNYVAKAENGEHYLECSVCGEKTDFTSDHIYLLVSASEQTAGMQTATFKCACGAEKTTVSPVIYKDAAIADVVGQNENFRDNSQGDPLGRFSPIVYKYVNDTSFTTEIQNSTGAGNSAAVISALKNNTTNGSYMSYLYGGAGVGYKIYAEKAGTVSVTIKAATGWILSTGTWKTGDMQFNKVFKFSVNGTAIPVADSVKLYGNKTGSSVYGEAMANWTYVTIDFKVNAGENNITLISCAPLKDGYEQRNDGHIYAVGGTTALTTRKQLREAMLYFDPGSDGTQSTAQLDSLAFYDLNGAGLFVSAN